MESSVKFRRNYFINKTFQLNFIFRFVLLVIAGGVISGFMLYFNMSHRLAGGPEIVYYKSMEALVPAIIITQLIVGFLIIIATVLVVLLLSHRIAGPLYRLERVAEHVGNGDLAVRVGIRQKDALMPLKSSFQKMIDKLQRKIQQFQEILNELKHIEQEFGVKVNGSHLPTDEKDHLMESMKKCVSRYEDTLKSFKMPDQ
jgi:methyl-accepting chemotaxis protein